MEVSALKYTGSIGLHGRSPLLRLQSDERLVALVRRGNQAAFETLVGRYEGRLLPFCRHMLRSREDAEDVLQEVFAAAFNAILADDRPINVRPWLYRIARNRSLNHLRRAQAIAVDTMDVHFSDHGASTADKVHDREEFRLLVGDIQDLPETQRTALLLREMEALSYEQIAEAMETTVPSVKSLLVRARVSLAEAAEARLLSCEEVRMQLGEVAEGLQRKPSALVRRHLKACDRCTAFQGQLKETSRALAALLPLSPLIVLKKLVIVHLGHSAGAGSGATAAGSGATAAGSGATAAGATALAGSGAGGIVSTAVGAVATKAAAGFAAAALVTAGAVEVQHVTSRRHPQRPLASITVPSHPYYAARVPSVAPVSGAPIAVPSHKPALAKLADAKKAGTSQHPAKIDKKLKAAVATPPVKPALTTIPPAAATAQPGRTQTQTDPTVLPPATTTPSSIPPPMTTASGSSATTTPAAATTPTDTSSTSGSTTTSTSAASPPPPPPGTAKSSGGVPPSSGNAAPPSSSSEGGTSTTTTASTTPPPPGS
jgi:RNA polymerase sigma factor (sigma-70 family)